MVERVRVNERPIHDPERTNGIGGPVFARGYKTGPGRPKGVPNKITTLLKDGIISAAEHMGEMQLVGRNGHAYWRRGPGGLEGYLRWLASHEPRAFAVLLGKVIPLHVVGQIGHTHEVYRSREQVLQELKDRGIPIDSVFPKGLATITLPKGSVKEVK